MGSRKEEKKKYRHGRRRRDRTEKILNRSEAERAERLAQISGPEEKKRFYAAFWGKDLNAPIWFFGIRDADRCDAKTPIDAFAMLDIGDIPIRIKPSCEEAWIQGRDDAGITVIIARSTSAYEIRNDTFAFLGHKRSRARNTGSRT